MEISRLLPAGRAQLPGRVPLVTALLVDSVGSGLFLPISILYFHNAAGLSIGAAGTVLTVAGLLGLPSALLAGAFIDRIGPAPVLLSAMALQACAFAGYTISHTSLALGAFAIAATWGAGLFWPSADSLIRLSVASEKLATWYGFDRAIRSGGLGVGAAISGFVVGFGIHGYQAVVTLNAASFVLAGFLIGFWGRRLPGAYRFTSAAGGSRAQFGYASIIRDRSFMRFMLGTVLLILCAASLTLTFPVYVIDVAHAPHWIPGILIAANTMTILLFQSAVGTAVEHRDAFSVLRLAGLLWGIGFLILSGIDAHWQVTVPLTVLFVAFYTGADMVFSPASSKWVATRAGDSVGRYMGAFSFAYSISFALAPVVLAFALSDLRRISWLLVAALCAASIILFRGRGANADALPYPVAEHPAHSVDHEHSG